MLRIVAHVASKERKGRWLVIVNSRSAVFAGSLKDAVLHIDAVHIRVASSIDSDLARIV